MIKEEHPVYYVTCCRSPTNAMLNEIIEGVGKNPRYPGYEYAFAEWFRNHFYQDQAFRQRFAEKLTEVNFAEIQDGTDFFTLVEWSLPETRPDFLIVTKNFLIVVEFKDGELWEKIRGLHTEQLKGYLQELSCLDWFGKKKQLIGVLVVSYPPDSSELELDRQHTILDC